MSFAGGLRMFGEVAGDFRQVTSDKRFIHPLRFEEGEAEALGHAGCNEGVRLWLRVLGMIKS